MRDHEHAMLIYGKLAGLSQQKRQLMGRDRFLLLTGVAAAHAGWPDVAERCRELVLANNQSHLIGRYESIADALRDPEFSPFLNRLERFCSLERAELLLRDLDVDLQPSEEQSEITAGERALRLIVNSES